MGNGFYRNDLVGWAASVCVEQSVILLKDGAVSMTDFRGTHDAGKREEYFA